MRRILILCLAACLAAGCAHKQTITTSQGGATVTTNQGNNTVTVTTKEGSTTYGTAVDPAKTGLPIYPGATKNEGGISGAGAAGSGETVALSTTDSFDKVYEWYKAHMPAGSETMHMTADSGSVATFQIGKQTDKEQRSVMITTDKDKTSILLSHNVKP